MPAPGLATLSHVNLDQMQQMFGTSSTEQSSHDLLSPIYNEARLPFPCVESHRLQKLLQLTQSVLDHWMTYGSLSQGSLASRERCKNFHQLVKNMPSSPVQAGEVYQDGVYESCRLTAVLMIKSLELTTSWLETAKQDKVLRSCREALSRTDLGDLWGPHIGLLYWIVLVMHCGSFRTPLYTFYHGILSRITFELTYRYDDWYGSVKPLANLQRIMQICQTNQGSRFSDLPTIEFPYRPRPLNEIFPRPRREYQRSSADLIVEEYSSGRDHLLCESFNSLKNTHSQPFPPDTSSASVFSSTAATIEE
jgi:hypothetical protein